MVFWGRFGPLRLPVGDGDGVFHQRMLGFQAPESMVVQKQLLQPASAFRAGFGSDEALTVHGRWLH